MGHLISKPKNLSAMLTLTAVGAVLVFLVTVAWVADRLATQFNAAAQQDALQRVERGIESMIEGLSVTSVDYNSWTEGYQAVHRQDVPWLNENIGVGAEWGGPMHLVVLGGGPLDHIHGWSAAQMTHSDYAGLHEFATDYALRHDHNPGDAPLSTFMMRSGELWLMDINWVTPHHDSVELVLPAAISVYGLSVEAAKPAYLRDTMLLQDVRLQSTPGDEGFSLELAGPDGPAGWVVWSVPKPGTAAMLSVAMPVGGALAIVVLAILTGTFAIRQLAVRLEQALNAAEAGSETKSAFLANMSHEIRTPLSGVLGMADMLADTPLRTDQREMLRTIRESGWGLLSLVDDILDLSRVESGKLSLEASPFSLVPPLERLRSLHGASAQSKGIKLDVRHCPGLAQHRLGDEMRLTQILHNLVGNAVKFTETGSVTLEVEAEDPEELVFRIIDTGIGMTEEQVSRIYEPFEQAEAGTSRRFGGSGLGMSIVLRLVELMGGTISISSAPGAGTSITLRLPMKAVTPAPEQRSTVLRDLPRGPADTAKLIGSRLLVADDNAANRKIIGHFLDKLGVEVVFATNGAEAYDLWREQRFDLVLLDISMPVMDGFDALQKMQQHSEAKGEEPPRAIAVTANVMTSQIGSYTAAGFIDTLAKPIRSSDLQERLLLHLQVERVVGHDNHALAKRRSVAGAVRR